MNSLFKQFRNTVLWCIASLLFILLLCLVLRNLVLRTIVDSKINRFNTAYKANLEIRKARFQWISTVFLTGFSLKPQEGDSLLRIDTLVVSVNIWKLLAGRLNISSLVIHNLYLTVNRRDSLTNYDFLLHREKNSSVATLLLSVSRAADSTSGSITTNYSETANRIFRLIFDKIPTRLDISNLNIRSTTNSHDVVVKLDRMKLNDNSFYANIMIREDSVKAVWKAEGRLDGRNRSAEVILSSADEISFPYIGFKWNASLAFDSHIQSFDREFQ